MCSDQSDAVAHRLLVAMHLLESTSCERPLEVSGRQSMYVCVCVWTRTGIHYGLNMTYAHHVLPKVDEHKLAQIGYVFGKRIGVCVRI